MSTSTDRNGALAIGVLRYVIRGGMASLIKERVMTDKLDLKVQIWQVKDEIDRDEFIVSHTTRPNPMFEERISENRIKLADLEGRRDQSAAV